METLVVLVAVDVVMVKVVLMMMDAAMMTVKVVVDMMVGTVSSR